jgi:hypothetical protein
MIFYIKEGNVLVSADYMGAATKRICDGVSIADYCEKTRVYVVTKQNGIVETRDFNGNKIDLIFKNQMIIFLAIQFQGHPRQYSIET